LSSWFMWSIKLLR